MMEMNVNGKKMSFDDFGKTTVNEEMAKEIQDGYIPSDEAIEDNRKVPSLEIKD